MTLWYFDGSLWANKNAKRCSVLAVSHGLGKHSEALLLTDLKKLQQVRAHSVDEDQD